MVINTKQVMSTMVLQINQLISNHSINSLLKKEPLQHDYNFTIKQGKETRQ